VHNLLGRYCNEKQYSDMVEKKLKELKIAYKREYIIPESFMGELKGRHIIDFLIDDQVILEIKTKRIIQREDYYQIKRYLLALNRKLGILVNFHSFLLHPKRILNSQAAV
jgi:GxxExxY protein